MPNDKCPIRDRPSSFNLRNQRLNLNTVFRGINIVMNKFRTGAGERPHFPGDTSTGLPWSQRPPDIPRLTFGLTPTFIVRHLAALDIFKDVAGIVGCIYLYVLLRITDKDDLLDRFEDEENDDMIEFLDFPIWAQRGLLFFIISILLLSLGFSVLLYLGAQQKSFVWLRYWFIYQLTMLLVYTPLHVWMFFYGWFVPEKPRKIIGPASLLFFLNYLWQGYHLYVVSLLMTDIAYPPEDIVRTRFNFDGARRKTFTMR